MRGRGRYGGARDAPSGPVLLGAAIILLVWGVIDGLITYRVYFHGDRGTGIIVRNERANDDTRLRVGSAECPVSGDWGPVGHGVPVAYPHGRPIECIVRRPSAFKWSAGAIGFGGAIVVVAVMMIRGAMKPSTA